MAAWWIGPFTLKTKRGNRVTVFGAIITLPLLALPLLALNKPPLNTPPRDPPEPPLTTTSNTP